MNSSVLDNEGKKQYKLRCDVDLELLIRDGGERIRNLET